MRFAKTSLAVSVSLALTACGGGGGGPGLNTNSNPYLRSSVPYYTPTSGGSYSVYAAPSTNAVIQDTYTQDLNSNGVDEVVVAGRMSGNPTTWQNTNVQIYGWNTGSFSKETSSWFSGTDNQIVGTEPSVKFGDFNGDGHTDMFIAPRNEGGVDSGPGVVYVNTGNSSFSRNNIDLGTNMSAHGSTVGDFNGDGYTDIMVADYNSKPAIIFGGSAGFTVAQATSATGASGVSAGDYLGNGSQVFIMTDSGAGAGGNQDTGIFAWSVAGGVLNLTQVGSALPASRFTLAKWSTQLAAAGVASHDIRNINMDFNHDGKPDVIVISTLPNVAGGSSQHGFTEVQFLRNDTTDPANPVFTDVTDSVLSDFNTSTFASYQPKVVDVNKDGLDDIILSGADYIGSNDSTQILLQTTDGKFKTAYASVFTDFLNQTSASLGVNAQGLTATVAAGPNGDYYLITAVPYESGGELKSTVFAAKIGSNGTTSVATTLANISTAWPYLSSVTANKVLARTASSFVNGIPVIDWEAVMNPVDGLGITLDGRTGKRIMLAGSISVPGLDKGLLSNLQAVDGIGRNFGVNLTSMVSEPQSMPVNYSLADSTDITRNWSSKFVDDDRRDWNGFSFSGQDISRFSTSVSNRHFGDRGPVTYRLGMTRTPGSPWFNFDGVFGSPESSTIFDFNATRVWTNGVFAQGGVMQTSTELNQGLVQTITPLWAGYAVAGYQDQQWTAYAGLQPTIFAGHLDMKLPTSVDRDGTMHYTNKTVEIRNQAIGFVGLERRWEHKNYNWKLSSVVNDQGQYQARLTYGYKF